MFVSHRKTEMMKHQATKQAPSLINLKDYPINNLETQRGQELVKACMKQLDTDGFLSLRNFLLPSANADLTSQVLNVMDKKEGLVGQSANELGHVPGAGFYSATTHNVYLQDSTVYERDPAVPSYDPRVSKQRTSLVCVGADELPVQKKQFASLAELYEYPPMIDFLCTVLSLPSLYLSEDPLGRYHVNAYNVGEGAGWHFDQADYSVVLILKPAPPGCGGLFQYAPSSRALVNEMKALPGGGCPEAIADFFRRQGETGGKTCLKEPELQSGDLYLFRGKESMHRVTFVTNNNKEDDADAAAGGELHKKKDSRRISLILTYNSTPGRMLTNFSKKKFFGRIEPVTPLAINTSF